MDERHETHCRTQAGPLETWASDDCDCMWSEVERLRADFAEERRWSVGWRDLAHRKEHEADRLRGAIEEHRDQVTSWNIANREPAPADKALWAVLDA